MPGNPLVRFDEGRVGRASSVRPLSYSTETSLLPPEENRNARQDAKHAKNPKCILCDLCASARHCVPDPGATSPMLSLC